MHRRSHSTRPILARPSIQVARQALTHSSEAPKHSSDQQLQQWHQDSAQRSQPLRTTVHWQSPTSQRGETLEVEYRCDASGHQLRAELGSLSIPLDQPVTLKSVAIPKPWGEEIWFTGMEARGEAQVVVADQSLPLSAYLTLAPGWIHQHADIVLLKILAPKAAPVTGDLYFEVHERKEETYVVTAIDPTAWPAGKGAIRYGVNQALRAQYADDDRFRQDYLAAVEAYERIRRLLDGELGTRKLSQAGDTDLLNANATQLEALEQQRRQAMEQFTSLLPLAVGDIVLVPPWHPHSLQHGVQVVEFQSPTYERYIISFAQQVLTQNHWDSATAIAKMSLEPLAPEPPLDPELPEGIRRIADYRDFGALRITLDDAQRAYPIPADLPYAVLICVAGRVRCGTLELAEGCACFVPALALQNGSSVTAAATASDSLFLIAAPGL